MAERAIPLVTAYSTMPDVIPFEIRNLVASTSLEIDVVEKLKVDLCDSLFSKDSPHPDISDLKVGLATLFSQKIHLIQIP